ncbi:hypothetical protein [Pseudogemmobacter bohemicus]|uniref:hypothetical protein n=1 Tax=Pseudogemmobacter bohemicus TaxID=2250708 RepID=UPI001300585F|nr:hypothetical protein [Pseudogemmobacter bohemicus]
MIEALQGLAPDLPGWRCGAPDADPAKPALLRTLPTTVMECRRETSSITLIIGFDPEFGTTTCDNLRRKLDRQSKGEDVGTGEVVENGAWISARTGLSFQLCSADQITVLGQMKGNGADPSGDGISFGLFHQAMLAGDLTGVLDLAAESTARLDEAYAILDAQSRDLDQLLPCPEGWGVTNSLLAMMESLEASGVSPFSAVLRLMGMPTASHTLSRGSCTVSIVLSSAPDSLQTAL